MDLASKLFKGDRVIWVIFMFLCLISAIEVFSATSTIAYKSATHWDPIVRHTTFLLGGFVLVLLLHNLPCRFYMFLSLLLPVSAVLLILTFFIGVEVNGEPRWLEILGIRFQPSEIAKITAIGYTAFFMSKRNWFTEKQIFNYVQIGVSVVCGLIFFTNGSTALLLFAVVQIMLFFGQVALPRLFKFWGILLIGISILVLLLLYTPDKVMDYMPDRLHTWRARIERFFDSEPPVTQEAGRAAVIDDKDYQAVNAKIAIARGGLWGKFPGHGQQRDFLPQAYSDFIYAIIIEEMGIAGGVFVLFLYMALLVRVGMIARKCDKLFPKFLVLGCGLLIGIQALLNMAVAVGLFPVTGQPLPLVSRGGTSTIISCAYIGIILSVSRFGANMGNEEDILPLDESSMGIEPETDGHGTADGPASVENGTGAGNYGLGAVEYGTGGMDYEKEAGDPNPLEAVAELKEETTTETRI